MSAPDADRIAQIRRLVAKFFMIAPREWPIADPLIDLVEIDVPWLLDRIGVLEQERDDAQKVAFMEAHDVAVLRLRVEEAEAARGALQTHVRRVVDCIRGWRIDGKAGYSHLLDLAHDIEIESAAILTDPAGASEGQGA